MTELFFTQAEAKQKLRRKVRSVAELPSVPAGTEGVVVKVVRSRKEDWSVRVEWKLAQRISFIDAGDAPPYTDLSRSAYEKSVEEDD
jgi:hypothetical protein